MSRRFLGLRRAGADFVEAGYLPLVLPLLPLLAWGFPERTLPVAARGLNGVFAAGTALFLFLISRRLFLPWGGPGPGWFLPPFLVGLGAAVGCAELAGTGLTSRAPTGFLGAWVLAVLGNGLPAALAQAVAASVRPAPEADARRRQFFLAGAGFGLGQGLRAADVGEVPADWVAVALRFGPGPLFHADLAAITGLLWARRTVGGDGLERLSAGLGCLLPAAAFHGAWVVLEGRGQPVLAGLAMVAAVAAFVRLDWPNRLGYVTPRKSSGGRGDGSVNEPAEIRVTPLP